MRDGRAFMVALEEHALGLHRFFHIRLRELKNSRDNTSIAKELVETTIERVLKYCRNGSCRDKENIKILLVIKAEDVWEEYFTDYNVKITEELKNLSDEARKALGRFPSSIFFNSVKVVHDKMARTRVNIVTLTIQGYNKQEISRILNSKADAKGRSRNRKGGDKLGNNEGKDC